MVCRHFFDINTFFAGCVSQVIERRIFYRNIQIHIYIFYFADLASVLPQFQEYIIHNFFGKLFIANKCKRKLKQPEHILFIKLLESSFIMIKLYATKQGLHW